MYLNAFMHNALPSFRYTSIQLNRGYACKLHVDSNNVGPSAIIAVGNFEGGDLWIMDEDGDCPQQITEAMKGWPGKPGTTIPGRTVSVKNRIVYFNGNRPHKTFPFTDERMSLVFFTTSAWRKMHQKTRAELERLGFPLPDGLPECSIARSAVASGMPRGKAATYQYQPSGKRECLRPVHPNP